MAKAEKNSLVLNIEWLDAHQVIESATSKYEDRLVKQLEAESPYIYADRFHLVNALNNLIDNAFKYSSENAEVKIYTENQNGIFIVAIKDNGIGIAPEYQQKVFKKFYRVPTGNVHNVKGFGIGLSYVRQIIKAQGWKIELQSEVNKGSEFRILIPLKK